MIQVGLQYIKIDVNFSIEWVSELLVKRYSKVTVSQSIDENTPLSDCIQSTLNKLFNIFCSHYTIKNSFDTHFIVDSISRLNNAVNQAYVDLQNDIKEIQEEFADESFNPFLEI